MQRFKDILFVAIPDAVNGTAMERAAVLADNNQARLTVVDIIDEIPSNAKLLDRSLSVVDLQKMIAAEHQEALQTLITPWNNNIEIQTKVLIGTPFMEIIREILRNGRDLVIKMAQSGSLLDQVFGSDDMHLLRKCPCPVWLFKSSSPKTFQRILAAVDVDDYYSPEDFSTRHLLNIQILEIASSLALSESAELHIVYAWEVIGEGTMYRAIKAIPGGDIDSYIEEVRKKYQQRLNVLVDEIIVKLGQKTIEYLQPKLHLLKGSPRTEIPALAGEIETDLVIMGTVARTGIPGFFMGNTAETIINHTNCSVLAIKPPGFVTPISQISRQ
jgi:universal stress protein E